MTGSYYLICTAGPGFAVRECVEGSRTTAEAWARNRYITWKLHHVRPNCCKQCDRVLEYDRFIHDDRRRRRLELPLLTGSEFRRLKA